MAIGTHSGTFHCDEALGCFLLHQTPRFKGSEVVRSRDPAVLDKLPIIIDVGGTYEPGTCISSCLNSSQLSTDDAGYAEKQRYDHHQRGFSENFGQGRAYECMYASTQI